MHLNITCSGDFEYLKKQIKSLREYIEILKELEFCLEGLDCDENEPFNCIDELTDYATKLAKKIEAALE